MVDKIDNIDVGIGSIPTKIDYNNDRWIDILIGSINLELGDGLFLFENIGNNTFEERFGSDNPFSNLSTDIPVKSTI